jgi:hypothetical protein
MGLYFNGAPVVGFGSEAISCPPGSSPVFDKADNYKCLTPDGSVPIKPTFQLPPGFSKCGDGLELHDGSCYDPRTWAALTAAKLIAADSDTPRPSSDTQSTSSGDFPWGVVAAVTAVVGVGGIIWIARR